MQKINSLDYHDIDQLIHYKVANVIPDYINTARQRATFIANFNPFTTNNNRLFFEDKEVIKKDDQHDLMGEMYKLYPGHGLNQFYEMVSHKYINVKKLEVAQFLKSQKLYQLTLRKSAKRITTKQYSKANQAWAIDLIDMKRFSNVQANLNYKYILSIVDLFSKKVFLRKIKLKTVAAVSAELATIFATEHPKLIVSDNGKEFLLEPFLANYNIKQIYQPSHVPQPNVENTNGQIRKLLSVEFAKQNNLVWIDRLTFIENNLNYYNLQVKKPKVFRNLQLKPNLRAGDSVRISFSVFDAGFRKNIKSGDQKYNNIKYTPRVYIIHNVYKPKTANGLS